MAASSTPSPLVPRHPAHDSGAISAASSTRTESSLLPARFRLPGRDPLACSGT
jgi:hypothetical protein